MTEKSQAPEGGPALTDEQWYDLAQRHVNADWNSDQPDGYLNAVKAVALDYAALAAQPQPHPSAEAQAQRDNAAFERGYQHGRQQERQIQEARQAPAEGDDERVNALNAAFERGYQHGRQQERQIQAAQPQPKGTQGDYLDGVNIARLRECLTFLGCASDGMEAMAASLPEFINRLTLAVERSRTMLTAPSPAPVDEVEELKAQNRAVAQLIIDNDKAGAVKWAQGLVASLDNMEVRAQAPAVKDERAAFEATARDHGLPVTGDNGRYDDPYTDWAWSAWQWRADPASHVPVQGSQS